MLEQLHAQIAAATIASTEYRARANGLAQRAADELAALGVTPTADTGTSSTVAGAVGIATAAVNAQAVGATFSQSQKSVALGKLASLGAQLASLGLT